MVDASVTHRDEVEPLSAHEKCAGRKSDDYYQNTRDEMLAIVPAGAKTVLEVGCGEGGFARRLTGSGREVWGVERDAVHAEAAVGHLDRVLIGDVEAVIDELPTSYFDLVVFNDVLEHLMDPEQVLLQTHRVLTGAGTVMSSIPNIRYFPILSKLVLRGKWEYEESGVLDRTHLRFFTSSSIVRMYQTTGFRVLHHEGINPMQLPTIRHRIVSMFLRGPFADLRYLQFATLAKPASRS